MKDLLPPLIVPALFMAIWFLSGCGELEEILHEDIGTGPVEGPTASPEPSLEPLPENPPCVGAMGLDGPDGFVMKTSHYPEGWKAPLYKSVVLFPSRFIVEFDLVEIQGRKGGWLQLESTGRNNGDRPHWRGQREVAGYIHNGNIRIRAYEGINLCEWLIPNADKIRND